MVNREPYTLEITHTKSKVHLKMMFQRVMPTAKDADVEEVEEATGHTLTRLTARVNLKSSREIQMRRS